MELHKYFQKKGIESYVAYGIENTDTSNDMNVFRIGNTIDHKLHAIAYRLDHMQGMHSTKATLNLLRKIEKICPDVILLHNLHSNYIHIEKFMLGINQLHIPVVIVLHDCWFFTGGCYHYTNQKCDKWKNSCINCEIYGIKAYQKYNINLSIMKQVHPVIIAISKWLEDVAKQSLLKEQCEIYRIYNWIDRSVFYPRKGEKVKKKYGLYGEKIILGVSTAWSTEKGIEEMQQLAEEMPGASIILVGKQNISAKYPPNVKCINFTESKDELAELYSVADVFVNPTKQETFGLVTGEALSCGTPVVVHNTTACPEFVTKFTGIIIDEQKGITRAVQEILDRIEYYGTTFIKDKCIEFAEENFDMVQNIEKYIEVLRKVTENNEARD